METLAERIAREGPVNELDAVGWIVRLAKKLESLHARGLAHGGVSPAAMKTASASRLSLGMLIPMGAIDNGLEFRSPERLDTEATSETDDAWSTAATLYALITGSSPFAAADNDTIRKKIRAGTFAPISSFDVGDDDLQQIIEAALNPAFVQRTSSLKAFREALEGWHPDSKVRELPPMVDDQPEDDDDDVRTVMRPVSAADAVRTLIAQREQAAAARASEPAKETLSNTKESAPTAAARPAAVAATNHGLLEDDEDNAKTSMISVPPMALLAKSAPATVPAPPPKDMMKSAPPPTSNPPTGFGMMRPSGGTAARAAGGTAARAPAPAPAGRPGAKATIVGGFTAKALMEQANQPAPPPPPPVRSQLISREALLDDGESDTEATVMREAPVDVMRKARSSISPPERKTPVDPTSAAVAAASVRGPDLPWNPTPPAAETSASFGVISMVEEASEGGSASTPRETPPSPARAAPAPALASPPTPSTPGLAASSNPGMNASPVPDVGTPPALSSPSAPAVPAPVPVAQAPASLAQAPVAPLPVVAPNPEPSAVKGLLIGVGIALVIIAIVAGVYFGVVKP